MKFLAAKVYLFRQSINRCFLLKEMTVMDPISIAGLAGLAAPYVAKGLDALTKSAGEKIGGVIGDLCQSVADKFKGDSYAEETLARAKEIPDSEERQGALKSVLAEKMKADPDFAEKVKKLVDEAGKGQAGTIFDQRGQSVQGPQTNIGEANGPVFSGNIGTVNSGEGGRGKSQ